MTTQSTSPKHPTQRVLMLAAAIVLVVGGGFGALSYVATSSHTIYIEKSQIQAPTVALAPVSSGILRYTYAQPGQTIAPNTVVAQVGVELVKSTSGGLVIDARTDTGASITPGTPVVTLIDPAQLRVVGQVEEDKGLSSIKVGDPAKFTVDAFGTRVFTGVVSEVSPTSRTGDVVFSISDKRPTQSFNVKVAFDTIAHPELKNGMSARIWVYKQQ